MCVYMCVFVCVHICRYMCICIERSEMIQVSLLFRCCSPVLRQGPSLAWSLLIRLDLEASKPQECVCCLLYRAETTSTYYSWLFTCVWGLNFALHVLYKLICLPRLIPATWTCQIWYMQKYKYFLLHGLPLYCLAAKKLK